MQRKYLPLRSEGKQKDNPRISLLHKYCKSFISDVVTGKVDVRDIPVEPVEELEEIEEIDKINEDDQLEELKEVADAGD